MTKPLNPHLEYRGDIDGLRAFAVVSVLIFHAFPDWLPGGFIGVDVFFVISGFLITSIILKAQDGGVFSFRQFYSRRVRRIFPALVLVVAASLVAGWHVLLPGEYAELAKHSIAGLGFVANLAYWQEAGYFDTAAELKPLLHLWSLGVEEQFYLVWPVLLFAAWKLRAGSWALVLLAFAGSFITNIVLSGYDQSSAYFLPFGRAWELLAGAVLVLLARRGWSVSGSRDVVSAAGLALLVASLFVIRPESSFPGWWAILPVLGTCLVIAAGPEALINRSVFMRRGMIFVGLISYPLYLWHWPLLSFARIVENGEPSNVLLFGCLISAFVLAWLTWVLLERPLRRFSEGRAVIGLLVAAVLVAAVSTNIFSRDGLNFRLKDAQVKSEALALEWPANLQTSAECAERFPALSGGCLIARDDAPPDIALFGDSHANHLYWGLSEEYTQAGLNLIQVGKGACVPVSGLDVVRKGRSLECADATRAALDFIVESDSIETVILSARWMLYLTGRELRDPVTQIEYLMTPVTLFEDIPEETRFAEAFSRTLDTLLKAGKRVVFVHAVPEMGFNARECLGWQPLPFVRRVPRPACAIERSAHEDRSAEFRPTLEGVLSRYPGVRVVDPADELCDEALCYARQDDVLLYRDDDHLSLEGSRWLASRLVDQLGR